ncbi:MAG: PLDc N-terminal domain-containing protein [Gammaproteobacteria bacterium]|nr:PLDc N-terminal domain-containing protein [Gammaproteobacteria bacterium]MBQ0838445.1 PLDc N-terminal domain-containing protein [Gammaproteobacteria bacterium]
MTVLSELDGLALLVNVAIALALIVAPVAMWHALLYKRDPRAAMGWISVCLLFPIVGPALYFFFGINRVHHRAQLWKEGSYQRSFIDFERGEEPLSDIPCYDKAAGDFAPLTRATYALTGLPLLGGNRVVVLRNGEEAFPAMLDAIAKATDSIDLSTYIFDSNRSGRAFTEALSAAVKRGVVVRVIIDAMGELYSWPRVSRRLRRGGVCVERFNPPRFMSLPPGLHLRNHRKLLVVDEQIAFAGGMNIGDRHLVTQGASRHPTVDTHFQFEGPVVAQLSTGFAQTWRLASGEKPQQRHADQQECGASLCRVIVDGPDLNLDKLSNVLMAAIAQAKVSIRIMTPYFLPSREMLAALQTAALRGVAVTLVLPEKNNLIYVHWAMRNMLWELLYYNINVAYQPPPFNHSKLFMVDGEYLLIGSANLDPRSLRLNYELSVEIYDTVMAAELEKEFDERLSRSSLVSLAELDSRSLLTRSRDALCWLLSPYL